MSSQKVRFSLVGVAVLFFSMVVSSQSPSADSLIINSNPDTTTFSEKKLYYENGTLKSRARYNALGELHGFFESYDESGMLRIKGYYTEGIRAGVWVHYNESGKVVMVEELNETLSVKEGKRQHRQGLAIYTHDPEGEIFINNKSYGKHDKVLIELETGEYVIEGRKRGYINEMVRVNITPGTVQRVNLTLKRVKFQLSPPLFLALMGEDRFQPGVIPVSGTIRFIKNNLNLYYAIGSGSSGHPNSTYNDYTINGIGYYDAISYDDKMYQLIGLNYTYSLIDINYLLFSIGTACNVSRFTATKNHWYYDSVSMSQHYKTFDYEDNFFSLGPRLSFQAGTKSFRFVSAFNYMIRMDNKTAIISKRNYLAMEHGMILEF